MADELPEEDRTTVAGNDWLKDIYTEIINPTCPSCNHRASWHVERGDNEGHAATRCRFHEEKIEEYAGLKRWGNSRCSCYLGRSEIALNLPDYARKTLEEFDKAKAARKEEQITAAEEAMPDTRPPNGTVGTLESYLGCNGL